MQIYNIFTPFDKLCRKTTSVYQWFLVIAILLGNGDLPII